MRFLPVFLVLIFLYLAPPVRSLVCPAGTAVPPPDPKLDIMIEDTDSEFNIESATDGPVRSLQQWGIPNLPFPLPSDENPNPPNPTEDVKGADGTPSPPPPPPRPKKFKRLEVCRPVVKKEDLTKDEVKGHNKPEDCYMIISEVIFDMTSYMSLNEHPAKNDVLLPLCGEDATDAYLKQHKNRDGMLLSFQNLIVGSVIWGDDEVGEEARRLIEDRLKPPPTPGPSRWQKFVPKGTPAPAPAPVPAPAPKPTPAPVPAPRPAPPPRPSTSWGKFVRPPAPAPVPVPTPAPAPAKSTDAKNVVGIDQNVNKNTVITKIIPQKDDRPVENNEDSTVVNDLREPLPPLKINTPAPAPAASSSTDSNQNKVVRTTTVKTTSSMQTFVIGPDGKPQLVPMNGAADDTSSETFSSIDGDQVAGRRASSQQSLEQSPEPAPVRTIRPVTIHRRPSWFRSGAKQRSRPVHVKVDVRV